MTVPYDLNALADGELRDEAINLVDKLEREGLPSTKDFGRTQLKRLQQLAAEVPEQVKDFANHQWKKIEDDKKKQDVVKVWQAIERACDSRKGETWSLQTKGESLYPDHDEQTDDSATGESSHEQQRRKNQAKKARSEFLAGWTRDVTPIFFAFFCTEYLYRIRECRP